MPDAVVIALISAAAGVAGAIISWVQAIKTGRLKAAVDLALEQIKADSNLALEEMKAAQERRRKAFELASLECQPVEAALGQAWQDIQALKENLARVASPARIELLLACVAEAGANPDIQVRGRRRLKNITQSLTDRQVVLAASRQALREAYIKRIIEALA
jgi:hypothetical protein